MRKTTKFNDETPILITTEQLMSKCNCGYATAKKIGKESKAQIYIGRRIWFNVRKIEEYLLKQAA